MSESTQIGSRLFQPLRQRLDAIRRRRCAVRGGTREFAMRRLEAKLALRAGKERDD